MCKEHVNVRVTADCQLTSYNCLAVLVPRSNYSRKLLRILEYFFYFTGRAHVMM